VAHSYRLRFRPARRAQGGNTSRGGGVPPLCSPPVPLGSRQLRSKHLRRAHSGCESNAPSNRDQKGVPIGDSRRLARGFTRAISVPTTAPTAGREQPPNTGRDGCPGKTEGLLTPRIHCRRRRETAVARHRTPRGLRTTDVCNSQARSDFPGRRCSRALVSPRSTSSSLALQLWRQPPLFVAAPLAASAVPPKRATDLKPKRHYGADSRVSRHRTTAL
jgi:hypothetical protein